VDQDVSETTVLPGTLRSAVVQNMARLVTEVYGHADEELRHAVQDSFETGIPGSVLLAADAPADLQR
jgi:hypothetical protein